MQTSPALQSAITAMPPAWQNRATSLISGPHKGSGHEQGRAVDIGMDGVPPNTWAQFLAAAISSGKYSAIGTSGMFVNTSALRGLAAKYGVKLFDDEGTGPHVHLEVAP